MIKSFKCKETERLHKGERIARFVNIERVAVRKLKQVQLAKRVEDLRVPPGNRLEKLTGDRAGQYSIRINEQWRVCFIFEGGSAFEVEIADYH
jgi:proteic killer suppression protein